MDITQLLTLVESKVEEGYTANRELNESICTIKDADELRTAKAKLAKVNKDINYYEKQNCELNALLKKLKA